MNSIVSQQFLAHHTVVDTRSAEEARHQIGRIFTPHFLSPREAGAPAFHAQLRSVRQDFFSLNLIRYGCEVDIDPGELSRCFLLLFPIAGSGRIRCGRDEMLLAPGGTAAILSPTLPVRIQWSADCETVVVLLEREAMERQWASMIDRPPQAICFAPAVDTAGTAGRVLINHVRQMFEGFESAGISSRYRRGLAECLMQLVLASFAHDQSGQLDRAGQSAHAGAIARAEEWIRANISGPFSVAEIAAASGASSLRSLQNMLRRERGTTLTEMIEAIRLDAFRTCLIASEDRRSVTDCALSAGLGHLGRAAIAYHRRYGETPSQTLRRRR
ncbi:MAG: AraC family transcriptional regulator [Alphaproteobacteria bacterium]|nr:AraC family transcriptional regulator [Alphaproteobacteria bacterium]